MEIYQTKHLDEVREFLEGFDLRLEQDVDMTVVAVENDKIIGTCSAAGHVIKDFAVSVEYQNEGVAAKLLTFIQNKLFDKGVYDTFIFTKPENKYIFEGLGYRFVEGNDDVVLLEGGTANVEKYVKDMFKKSGLSNGKKAALVMNCNPFTLGHRFLIETASYENDEVVVFIVEENRSLFPFDVRLNLVKEGVKDLKNVAVIPGGRYIISSATFPSYFLRQEDERLRAYTRLDAAIFGKYIAKEFNIDKRYVGTEPYCNVTDAYNNALVDVLPSFGIEVRIVERKQIDNTAVSASFVRELIRKGKIEDTYKYVPETTFNFLVSDEAKEIIDKIKRSDTPH
ncbi:[Citrate [pro-3S]-lyase] ligase [Caloramator mitchellensis]|uniref:[Citrate [pro-3S]-lyase] ligase n=1 Tax=Caloramator mitchellensis TaxID=908809 RepID=A0A0R3JRK5_CALMK|nr:[citrate (pro-3S)-lyase] ligase [Caloramator mitchellensis]KRQ86119.1 [Citrate [pro-3S]-lyase] ligase [Caloramator mitchellensis]